MSKKLKLGNHVLSFMYLIGANFNPKNNEHLNILEEFENDVNFQEREENLTLTDEYDRLVLKEITYNRKKDFQNALKYGILQHDFNKETIYTTLRKFESELDSLANVLIVSIEAGSNFYVDLYLKEINNLVSKYKIDEIDKLHQLNFIHIIYSLYHFARNEEYKDIKNKCIEQWELFEDITKTGYKHPLYPNAYLYYYLIKFKNREYDTCLKLLIKYQIDEKEYSKSATNEYVELYKIICFLELNQYDLAADLLSSFKRKKIIENSDFFNLSPKILTKIK